MIIACPACKTRYVVPDSAIGVEGRTVRCAKCKHSWFQDGSVELAEAAIAQRAAASAERAPESPPSEQAPEVDQPRDFAPAAERDESRHTPAAAVSSVAADPRDAAPRDEDPRFDKVDPPFENISSPTVPEDVAYDEDVSQFDHRPPFRPRRNWMKLASWGAALFAVVALGTVALVSTVGLPSWLPLERPLFAVAPAGLKIAFPASEQERRTLPNGSEFFGARIVVTNQTRETQSVPPLLIVLRDGRNRVVYSWQVNPTQKKLAPGEAMTINEGITDVPKSAVYADIGWAPK